MIINGWTIIAHPLFIDQLEKLVSAVEAEKKKDVKEYKKSANAKLLANIVKSAFSTIPSDPANKRFRLGDALGKEFKDWFRDKFGSGRFRLFFRYDSKAKVIILAWVNDENTLRTYGSKSDAYAVFASKLDDGNPPADWESLFKECNKPTLVDILNKVLGRASQAQDKE